MIYVIGEKGSTVVKIGFTGGKPSKRLGEIQTGNPAPLAVLWAGEGDKTLEERLHSTFRPH
ncbi:GIY-YIG nuclease family protein, partial [Streptomyces prasinopilosus]|uniref:GIY-YIG nuclease family protein n=1 Tax=Streptomyces prasinopilosus TaxID=67344 RepID=UPI000A4C1BB8